MKRKRNHGKIYLFLAVLAIFFGLTIFYYSFPLLFGKTFVLETEQVDPFDLFRGQYLMLAYPVGRLNGTSVEAADVGKTVYIGLQVGPDGVARATGAWLEKPSGDFIKGKIIRDWRGVSTELGIEQYFFERNAEINTTRMQAQVKIDPFGNARITGLLRDGKPIEIKYSE